MNWRSRRVESSPPCRPPGAADPARVMIGARVRVEIRVGVEREAQRAGVSFSQMVEEILSRHLNA